MGTVLKELPESLFVCLDPLTAHVSLISSVRLVFADSICKMRMIITMLRIGYRGLKRICYDIVGSL